MGWIILALCATPFIHGIISEIQRQRAFKAALKAAEHVQREKIQAREEKARQAIQARIQRDAEKRKKAQLQKEFLETRLLSLDEQYNILLELNRKVKHDITSMDEKQLKRLLSIEKQIASVEKQRNTIYSKMVDIEKHL